VLVERTVKDVLPALNTNADGLKQVLEELVKQYKGKQDDMDKWKASIPPQSLLHSLTFRCRKRTTFRLFKTRHICRLVDASRIGCNRCVADGMAYLISCRQGEHVWQNPSPPCKNGKAD
jgi:hypothetical protein